MPWIAAYRCRIMGSPLCSYILVNTMGRHTRRRYMHVNLLQLPRHAWDPDRTRCGWYNVAQKTCSQILASSVLQYVILNYLTFAFHTPWRHGHSLYNIHFIREVLRWLDGNSPARQLQLAKIRGWLVQYHLSRTIHYVTTCSCGSHPRT